MKNFTNNFKQFTSRLSARWLIMALMMLVGTSSAWAASSLMGSDFPNGNWDGGIGLPCTLYLESKTYNFKVKENGTWYEDQNEGTMSPGDSWKFYNYSKGNTKLKITTAGYYTLSWNESTNTFSVVEAIATAYVVGGYYGGNDKNYTSGKKLTKQSDGTYSGTFSDFSGSCYFQIYDDLGRVWGCDYVKKNVGESVTLNTSKNDKVEYSLTNGISYILSFNPSDGTFSVKTSCTDPKAADFSYVDPEPTYDGTAKSATVKWKDDNTSTGITVKYGGSTTAPTNAGTYAITVSTTAHGNICASKSDISLGDFTINKADQTALSISTAADVCGKSVTLATSGGTGTGSVAYSISGTNNIGASISGTTLSATSSGSVKVKATKSGGTNYNDATVEKTFNFTMPIENVNLSIKQGLSASGDYCVGTEIQLQLTYTGATPANDGNHFEWVTDGFSSEIGNNVGGIATGATWTTTLGENDKTLQVKLKDCNGNWVVSNPLTFNVHVRPEAPKFTPSGMTVCQGEAFTLPGSEGEGYIWSDALGKPTTANKPNGIDATTDYYAVISFGCPSPATKYTVTVNPLPIVSIAGNTSAVFYEDVMLTATATDGATVKWYEGGVEKATGTTYVVTSSSDASKIVTAKAFLGGCESAVANHTVNFSAEDCADVTTTKEETVGKIKLLLSKPSWIGSGEKFYCYAWENNTTNTLLGGWPGTELTQKDGNYYYVVVEANNKDIKIILNDNSEQTVDSDVLNANKIYQISATSSKNSDNKYTFNSKTDKGTYKESVTTTVPAPITTPAVKTVSVNSEQGSGVVEFTGQIIKTGCAATSNIYYGYQFKKADEEWPTTGVEASNTPVKGKLIPLTNASETALYYQFSAGVENLEDGDYHFRAYIINGYHFSNGNYDQGVYYGLDKLVTVSTVQTPVRTATITLTDEKGNEVDKNKKYCVGETGYIKVTSDVKYTTIKWKTDKGTEIEETGNNGIYPFVAKGDDNIWVMLSNKHNDIDRPAINQEPLVVNTFADPILPRVSLNKVSICSNDAVGATVKLTNVVKGQTYQLYQQIDKGDGTFTEKAIGEAKTQTEEVTDKTELVLHTLTNTAATGKYFVKTYTTVCEENIVATQPFTFTVVDAAEVFISIDPASAETTPWMPAKFTVNASDKYTLNVTKGIPAEPATEVEVNQNGNNVSVKIPLPKDTQHVTGQYQNVSFPQGATTQYTITATLSATGGDNPCADPASATVNLVPYVEECTIGH